MWVFWLSVIRPLLVALGTRVVVEVGVARGETTRLLLEWAAEHECVIHGIDPTARPRLELAELQAQYGDRFVFHRAISHDALPQIRDADAVLIDGDHNWYSVNTELKILAAVAAEERRPFPLTLIHDVDWPYGRRDMYYDPETIPTEYRHEWVRGGLFLGVDEPAADAGLNRLMNHAVAEGTTRNGTRTAVEDFLAETDLRIAWSSVPGYFGIGVLVGEALLEHAPDLRSEIQRLRSPAFLDEQCRRLEQDRMRMVIELDRMRRKISALQETG